MQEIQINQNSMMLATPVYKVGEDLVFGLMRDSIGPDSTDDFYVVKAGEEARLDSIAYSMYGKSELWWVIAMVNGIIDPMTVYAGQGLRIPKPSRIPNLNNI